MYRKLFLIVLGIIASSNIVFAQWQQTNGPEGGYINSLDKVANQIWASTMAGIYVSSDEGVSWVKLKHFNNCCLDVLSFNDTVIVIYSTNSYPNGSSNNYPLYSVTSFDNGLTWNDSTLITTTSGPNIAEIIKVKNELILKPSTLNGKCFTSTDFGNTWDTLILPTVIPNSYISDIITDGKHLVYTILTISDNTYTKYLSKDNGSTWKAISSSKGSNNVFIRDSVILLTASFYDSVPHGFILRSLNEGITYDTVFKTPPNVAINSLLSIGDSIFSFGSYQYGSYRNEVL